MELPMANVLAHLSSILIPAVIFFVIGYGWIHKCNLYDDFINGAADGLKTVVGIVPTLIGLMMAVGILRGSGLLDLPGKLLQKYAADSSISGMFPEFSRSFSSACFLLPRRLDWCSIFSKPTGPILWQDASRRF